MTHRGFADESQERKLSRHHWGLDSSGKLEAGMTTERSYCMKQIHAGFTERPVHTNNENRAIETDIVVNSPMSVYFKSHETGRAT